MIKVAALFSILAAACLTILGSPLVGNSLSADITGIESLIWPFQSGKHGLSLVAWLSAPDSTAGWVRMGLAYYPLYHRFPASSEEARAEYSFPSVSTLWQLEQGAWRWGVGFSRGKSTFSLRLPTEPPQESRLSAVQNRANVSGFMERAIPLNRESRIGLSAGLGTVMDVGNPSWYGAYITPLPHWNFTFEHRLDYHHLHLDYLYEDEVINLPLNLHTVGDLAELNARLHSAFSFSGKIAKYAFRSSRNDFEEQAKTSVPQGGFLTQSYRLDLRLIRRLALWLYHRQDCLDSQVDFYDEGLKFGKITRGDLFLSLFDIGAKLPGLGEMNLSLVYRYLTVNGFLKGHLEFWPFAPTFIDLLGLRRYYEGEFEAECQGFFAQLEGHRWGTLRADYGLGVWLVEPTGSFSHWQPQFLVFGKTDERTSVVNVLEAWVGAVSFELSYEKMPWMGSLQLRQLLPVHVSYVVEPEAPTVPGAPVEDVTTYGGGFINFALVYFFR
jgi:hypothetical protein